MNTATARTGELLSDPLLGLSYRLVQPVPVKPRRCVILLHGVGSHETHIANLANGMAADTLVVLAHGPLTLGPGQYAWFRVAFGANGPSIHAEEAEHSRQTLIHFVQQLQHHYDVSAANTVIAGFSQGGIMSASVGLSAPESVAGFGLLSGRILPELEPHLASPQHLTQLKAFVGHGEHDPVLPVAWAHRSDALLSRLRVAHELHLYAMDHGISAEIHADFLNWLGTVNAPVTE